MGLYDLLPAPKQSSSSGCDVSRSSHTASTAAETVKVSVGQHAVGPPAGTLVGAHGSGPPRWSMEAGLTPTPAALRRRRGPSAAKIPRLGTAPGVPRRIVQVVESPSLPELESASMPAVERTGELYDPLKPNDYEELTARKDELELSRVYEVDQRRVRKPRRPIYNPPGSGGHILKRSYEVACV